MCVYLPAGGSDGSAAGFGTESASSRAWRELAGSLCAVASVSPGESSRHRGNHHQHHHDYQSSGDEANEDGEEDYIAAAEAAIAALGSRVDSRCRSFRDCKPLLIHNSSGTAAREFRRAPVQVQRRSLLDIDCQRGGPGVQSSGSYTGILVVFWSTLRMAATDSDGLLFLCLHGLQKMS